jgi:Cof subfamily protein (haloacid dehalogenase superfamily)
LNGVLFFDLDGTLLAENSRVTQNTKDALLKAKQNSFLPVIATGRSLTELDEDRVFEETGIDSAVILDGMAIYAHHEPIFQDAFSNVDIEQLLHVANSLGQEIGYYSATERFNSGISEDLDAHYEYFHQEPAPTDRNAYQTRAITMLLAGTSDLSSDDFYRQSLPQMSFFRNSPYSMDVTKQGVDKGSGVKRLLAALDIDPAVPTYGFGDGANDIALLTATTHKIAMGNAIPELKEIATLVTSSNVDDGIVEAFQELSII